MDRESTKRLYVELLRDNFEKILTELELVYKLSHSGEKGREAEEILKNFLRNYLPNKYEVTTGFIHTDRGISNQSDILVYDSINYAPLYSGYANKIIHMGSLRAVIECTMKLDKRKIEEDNKKIENFKNLYRTDASIQDAMSRDPIAVLFAYKSEGNLLKALNQLTVKNFDIVFSAEGHLYSLIKESNEYTNNFVDDVYNGETIHGYTFTKAQHAFSLFYSLLIDHLNTVTSNPEKYKLIHEYNKSAIYIDYKELKK